MNVQEAGVTASDLPGKLTAGCLMVHPPLESTSKKRQSAQHSGTPSLPGGCGFNSQLMTFYHITSKTGSDPLFLPDIMLAMPSCGLSCVPLGTFTSPSPAGASFRRADRWCHFSSRRLVKKHTSSECERARQVTELRSTMSMLLGAALLLLLLLMGNLARQRRYVRVLSSLALCLSRTHTYVVSRWTSQTPGTERVKSLGGVFSMTHKQH